MNFKYALLWLLLLLALSACSSPSPTTPASPSTEIPPGPTIIETAGPDPRPTAAAVPTEMATATVAPAAEVPPTPTVILDGATFEATFGGERRDRGISLIQTADGGYAIIGYTSSLGAGQEDVYLVRTDGLGQELWSNTYGGDGNDNGWEVLETADGGFLIVGFTDSFGAGEMDIYLVQTDADGNMLWERTFGGPESEFGWAMAPTADGGYVLAGQTNSFGEGAEDGYLVKVDAQGEEIWSQTYGGPEEDRLFSIDQGSDGGFIMTGTTRSFGEGNAGNRDAYLVKVDDAGELDWMQVFGESPDDVGHAVRQTADEGYIITGYTRSFDARNYDTWLIKTDTSGSLQWQSFYGGPADDRAIYGEQTTDGGFILIGYTQGFQAAGWDLFLVRTDPSGEVTWHKTFGGPADDTGYTVIQASDDNFILTGETNSFGEGGGDMYVIKVDQDAEISE